MNNSIHNISRKLVYKFIKNIFEYKRIIKISTFHFTILITCLSLNNIIKNKLLGRANLGHCNRAAVSRNRYGVEKTVDTHTILINAIKCYVCLQEI